MDETKVLDTYSDNKILASLCDFSAAAFALFLVTASIFWWNTAFALGLLTVHSVVSLLLYASGKKYNLLWADAMLSIPRENMSNAEILAIRDNYINEHKNDYSILRMIPTVLMNKHITISKPIKTFDHNNTGTTVSKQATVKWRDIVIAETTHHTTLAMWDKARSNALNIL